MAKHGVIIFFYLTSYYTLSQQSAKTKMCEIDFDRENFIVHFAPWVQPNVQYDDESKLKSMIRTISKRFSKLGFSPVTSRYEPTSDQYAPNAVAIFNSNLSSNVNPLRVIIQWKLVDNAATSVDQYSYFKYAIDLADQANGIFNGTVYTIALEATNLSQENVEQMKLEIHHAKSVITSSSIPYELGATFDITSCESTEEWLLQSINEVVSSLKYLVFKIALYQEDFNNGVDTSVKRIVERFERCERKLQIKTAGLKLGLSTSWPDTDENGKQNISNLVRFWEQMNKFAVSRDRLVVMVETFDIPFRIQNGTPFAHQGWWKLNESIEYLSPEEYVFEEKCMLAQSDDPTKGKLKLELSILLPSIAASLLLITIFCVYWKFRKIEKVSEVTAQEIREFFEGCKDVPEDLTYHDFDKIDTFPYDICYEINSYSFTIDESVTLGTGEFGSVSSGTVKIDYREIPTAIKRAKRNSATALKSLMCEIKVLSYIGYHKNIVRFMGAHTSDLKKGVLHVFLELCPLGSLQKYLKRHRNKVTESRDYLMGYSELTSEGNLVPLEKEGEQQLIISDDVDIDIMRKWCRDILSGMEYLASMRLVHADLATRNVLLDQDRRAKICDFGLSRRLNNYSTYFKTQSEPLPWRWMSPESLRQLEFNEKTDVWAFGVTVWEICSFGDVPYPGLSWSPDFSFRLESGLRLKQPTICSIDLYKSMRCCWAINPVSRPTFSELLLEFD